MIPIDGELTKTALTIAASIITTFGALAKWIMGSIKSLDDKIDNLSITISKLDKNIAVQGAIFEQHLLTTHKCAKGGLIYGDIRNKETS